MSIGQDRYINPTAVVVKANGNTNNSSSSGGGGGDIGGNYNNLINKPSINGVVLEGNKTTEELGIEVNTKCALQVQVSFNSEVLSGVAVVVGEDSYTTKNNGLAMFTGLDKGEKTIEASKDGYLTATETKQVDNPVEFTDIEMTPIELTFTVTDEQENALAGATIVLTKGTETSTKTTDNNGQATFNGLLDGTYSYSIGLALYDVSSGTITIDRQNETEPVTMYVAPIGCYAEEAVTLDDEVKVNMGVGNSDTDYNVYASNTSTTNELTLDGLARETGSAGDTVPVRITLNNAEINVVANEDNADIQFNNSNEINEVNINVVAKDIYVAFTKGADTMYFKNNTLPFVASENTFESKSYTYYTYANGTMSAHTATTSSVSVGANTYDGVTLILDTTDTFSNGTWTKDETQNIEIDDGDVTIITSGYLTTPQPIIPRTNYFRFALGKLNPEQWDVKLLIGGQEKQFIHMQEFIVQSNRLIEIYQTKHGSTNLIDTYNQYFYISNDRFFKKVNFQIASSEANSTFKFTINGSIFTYTGDTANIDAYAGQTINWEVSKDTFVTQTGSYSVPSYPTIKTYDAGTKTLVAQNLTFKTFEKQVQTIETVGDLVITDGVASGFSTTSYLQTTVPFAPGNNSWSIKVPFMITSSAETSRILGTVGTTNWQGIEVNINTSRQVGLYLSSNGTSWNLVSVSNLTPVLALNTLYYVWIIFDGIQTYQLRISTDNQTWTTYRTVTSTSKIYQSSNNLGIGVNLCSTGFIQGTINVNGIDIWIKPPLASVDIVANSSTYTTDNNGQVTISSLQNGTYPYTVSKTGYQTQTGSVTLNGASQTKELLMEAE